MRPSTQHEADAIWKRISPFTQELSKTELRSIFALVERRCVMTFANSILHGDEQHRQWLIDAAESFINNQPLPQVRP